MSECVQVAPDGTLVFTGQPVSECSGYVLVSGAEHALYAFVQQMLETPSPEVLLGWFSGCVGLVLSAYFAAYGVGRIVGMFNTR